MNFWICKQKIGNKIPMKFWQKELWCLITEVSIDFRYFKGLHSKKIKQQHCKVFNIGFFYVWSHLLSLQKPRKRLQTLQSLHVRGWPVSWASALPWKGQNACRCGCQPGSSEVQGQLEEPLSRDPGVWPCTSSPVAWAFIPRLENGDDKSWRHSAGPKCSTTWAAAGGQYVPVISGFQLRLFCF